MMARSLAPFAAAAVAKPVRSEWPAHCAAHSDASSLVRPRAEPSASAAAFTINATLCGVMRGLEADLPKAERDDLRRLEVARLDALSGAHWERATLGDLRFDRDGEIVRDADGEPIRDAPNYKAAALVLRCIAQRCRLLGLDAPVAVQVAAHSEDLVRIEVRDVLTPEFMAAAENCTHRRDATGRDAGRRVPDRVTVRLEAGAPGGPGS
jgi:hypothetical protein